MPSVLASLRKLKQSKFYPVVAFVVVSLSPFGVAILLTEVTGTESPPVFFSLFLFSLGFYGPIISRIWPKFLTRTPPEKVSPKAGQLERWAENFDLRAWWKRRTLPVRTLTLVAWAAIGVLGLYRVAVIAPIRAKFLWEGTRRYGMLSQLPSIEAKPHLKGSVLMIHGKTAKLDTLMFALPQEMWATSPETVGTVVLITRGYFVSGHYMDGSEARTQFETLSFVDMPNPRVRTEKTFFGGDPPDHYKWSPGLSRGASGTAPPLGSIIDYVRSLPRA